MAGKTTLTALMAAAGLCLAAAAPSSALAGGSGAGCGCKTTPPPPPPPPCNCSPPPGPTINVPGVNVSVAASVVVNTNVNVQTTANAEAASQTFSGGGGAAGGISPPVTNGIIQGMDVGAERRSAYEAMRTFYKKVVIQAFCFDDKMTPHPASQVTPDRDIDDAYDGELYRCIAGTHMQVTIASWKENISFAGGETLTCHKGEALYHVAGAGDGHGGRLECRPQKPARDCNERSLLRRFGAGIKILTLMVTEKYTAYHEESSTSAATTMSLDGGVGGVAY